MEEFKASKNCYFVTLTYNDENIYRNSQGVPSVSKEEFQLFIKKLRKKNGVGFRYYAVGEYGTNTNRNHYHFLGFNCSPNFGDIVSTSWNKGHIMLGEVNIKTIKYITKYHVNRGKYPEGANKPFVLMSKGIGNMYIENMRDFHAGRIDNSYYPDKNLKRRLPRYYKDKLYSKLHRNVMATMFQDEEYTNDKIDAYKKKYPNGSYFEMMYYKIENHQKSFREKNNFSDKF